MLGQGKINIPYEKDPGENRGYFSQKVLEKSA